MLAHVIPVDMQEHARVRAPKAESLVPQSGAPHLAQRRPLGRNLRGASGLQLELLDCYWVGSLDFSFLGNQGFSIEPKTSSKHFGEGSAATKAWTD